MEVKEREKLTIILSEEVVTPRKLTRKKYYLSFLHWTSIIVDVNYFFQSRNEDKF